MKNKLTFFGKILCFLRLHKWYKPYLIARRCKRCDTTQLLVAMKYKTVDAKAAEDLERYISY